ncbi:MAG TPA: PDR/VanB family oxidoreductase [Microbacterium sp.]|nr:PDR/VanB family oxidoreductase [Microbacterium sp.]
MSASPALRDGIDVVVRELAELPGGVRSVAFGSPDGAPLTGYPAGSHIVVECGDKVNAYSLTGIGDDPSTYTISVLRDDAGAGGSIGVHAFELGQRVRVSRPRSAFPQLATARRQLLVAAGIGVTPILSHARAAARWNRPARVLYVHRPGADAHAADLHDLAARHPSISVAEFEGRAGFSAALDAELRGSVLGTHLYACGPGAFMADVRARAEALGWPGARVHTEAFGAAALDAGEPFTAVIAGSGERVDVPAGVSLLEALEATGREIPNLCRQGVCGECRLSVSAGTPLHRDHYLSPAEREAGDAIMSCVSRSTESELELEL